MSACGGGGDKSPTGPGNDGGQQTINYQLASLGKVGLPADLQIEDCAITRFYSGRMQVTDDGSWEIVLQVHDFSGDWGYLDRGEVEQDGVALQFDSEVSGVSYQGQVDGSEIKIMYDWCANGVPDVQLVFDR
jgi:hypothetical protein